MDNRFKSIIIINKKDYANFEKVNYGIILDITSLDNSLLIEIESDDTNTMLDNGSETHNVNVSMATSLSFGIFLTQYLNKLNIPMLFGKTANDIRLSYTGGSNRYVYTI